MLATRTMWMARVMLGLIVTAGLLSGCVTKGKYNELQADFDRYKEQSEERDAINNKTIMDLQEALAAEQVKSQRLTTQIAGLEGDLAGLRGELAGLQTQIEGLNAEKASLVKDRTRLQASEADMREALNELSRRKAEADKRIAEYKDLLSRFQSLIDAGKLRIRIIDGQMVVQLATDVLFPSGSAELSAQGKEAIIEVTGILAGIADRRFQVAGHTDNVPIRTSKYPSNWELAFDRAMSVVRTMVGTGMPATRVSAASYAEFKPAAANDNDANRAQNRRIEIIVVPDLSKLPGAEELERLDQG